MKASEEKKVAFFGKITAGITHEMKNVLAIIKESSGLMEDIMSLSPEALISYQEKFKNSLSKIKDQINRGVELTDRLNKFAHSSDETIAKIDLNEIVEQLIKLSQRFARLKNVVLKTDPRQRSDQPVIIETFPVQLQMALFACIDSCLNVIPSGSEIFIRSHKKGEKYAVHVACEGNISSQTDLARRILTSDQWPELEGIVAALGGSVELDSSGPGIWLFLSKE